MSVSVARYVNRSVPSNRRNTVKCGALVATRDAPVTSPRIAATRAADRAGVGSTVMPVSNVPITDTVTPPAVLADEAAAVDRNTPVRLYERFVPATGQHRILVHTAPDQLAALDELVDGPVPDPEV